MRVHFFHWYVHDSVIFLEEGNLNHPLCPLCYMLVPWCALIGIHLVADQ